MEKKREKSKKSSNLKKWSENRLIAEKGDKTLWNNKILGRGENFVKMASENPLHLLNFQEKFVKFVKMAKKFVSVQKWREETLTFKNLRKNFLESKKCIIVELKKVERTSS